MDPPSTATIELPGEIPFMALSGATVFPNALLPLYIFEPRYRQMLEFVLQEHRIFGIGMVDGPEEWDLRPIAGTGVVRACVRNDDGTSNLILQGICRVRILEWTQQEPFRIARIQPLASQNKQNPDLPELTSELREFCSSLNHQGVKFPSELEELLDHLDNPDVLSDVIASTLVSDAHRRQQLLEEFDLAQRIRLLLTSLEDEFPNAN